ncbi:MAG: helical backbone metal receptor [Gemmatimonadota bacterium]
MRIVSLACSNTEIIAALGCSHLLVGVDDHSDHPHDVVNRLPRLGPDLQIDLEAVEALAPDLVLASLTVPGHETVVEGLEYRGIPCLTPEADSLEDVYRNIREVAHALAPADPDVVSRGTELIREMRQRFQNPWGSSTDSHRARSHAPPRVLVQWWPKPVIAPGKRSWTHDVVGAAGGVNASGGHDVKSRPFTWPEVVELAPDAIVISWCGVDPQRYRPDVVLSNPELQGVPAVQSGRVFSIPEAYLGRPGPRLVEGLAALRSVVDRCTHPPSPPSLT